MNLRRLFAIILLSVMLAAPAGFSHAAEYPRTANYFLRWNLTPAEIIALAKWDVVILDMEIQAKQPDALAQLRKLNPKIILLAYITPQEIFLPTVAQYSTMRTLLAKQIPDVWYLTDTAGKRLSFWQNTTVLNVSAEAPAVNGERWQDYLPRFVATTILGSGLWDGVFFDNGWDKITDHIGFAIDADKNGVPDSDPNKAAREGLMTIMNRTRTLTNNKYVVVLNASSGAFAGAVNGAMIESLIPATWVYQMNAYRTYARAPSIQTMSVFPILNANAGNRATPADYRSMRFGLTSSLLENGYYSFDYGDQDHGQTWRYDEYGVTLGTPTNDAASVSGRTAYTQDVYLRQFDHGIAVVNSTGQARTVDLGGDYEKLRGTQDPVTNDGAIVSELTVPAYDGQILLKTTQQLNDVLHPNGAFVRFFHANGSRARNGFFAFDDAQSSESQVAHVDLNGNGTRDLLVVSGNKLLAWRDDGQPYMAVYPYGANYKGELRVSVGDVNGDQRLEVIVAPSSGYGAPIKIYSYDGNLQKTDWYPFGTTYKQGYSVAVGNFADGRQVIVGKGKGGDPLLTFFSETYKKVRSWFAFESRFRGGVSVATGDIDGNGIDEVVVGAGPGKKPVVRVYDNKGKLQGKEFTAFSAIGTPGVTVGTTDVDFDGFDEIVTMSRDVVQ